jgi:hypothetical protein
MIALNRWEDWLAKACAASCWLSPLPLECVAEGYCAGPGERSRRGDAAGAFGKRVAARPPVRPPVESLAV